MAPRAQVQLTVVETARLAPRMRRIVLGGPGFSEYLAADVAATDKYVKLAFDIGEERPALRTYTVRWVDEVQQALAIDFVTHGDHGLAGPWAARADIGDTITLRGPGGGYRPLHGVDHHLFVGDESALPAIASSLEALGDGDHATAFIEVDGPEHEVDLPSQVDVHWLHRDGAEPGTTTVLDDAVTSWNWPGGRVQAFVHGESALLKSVRPYLLADGLVDRKDLSVSAYWRRGETEEGFRQWKHTQDDAVMRPNLPA